MPLTKSGIAPPLLAAPQPLAGTALAQVPFRKIGDAIDGLRLP